MESLSVPALLALAGCLVIGLLLGYLVGSRRSRRSRRELQQSLNIQGLDLLAAKTDLNQLKKRQSQSLRKDRLLVLALQKLKRANLRTGELMKTVQLQERRHYIKAARLRLAAVRSSERANQATDIAQRATNHLRRLEQASPITQTINAPTPKSYGHGESVTVSVVDQQAPDRQCDSITRVSNRDSAMLTRLHSSNEGRRT